jgi:VWFA-related protein
MIYKPKEVSVSERTLLTLAALTGCALVFTLVSCSTAQKEQPYSNPNDMTTTDLVASIVQVDTGHSSPGWVKVYLSVTDQDGTPLENFKRGNFEVSEVTTTKTYDVDLGDITLSTVGQSGQPVATAMVMDYSGSMSGQPSTDMETAVKTFIGLMQTQDKAEIIKFSDYAEVVQSFTSNKSSLTAAVDGSWPGAGGMTALCDGIWQGVTDAGSVSGMRAVIAFTDGKENSSSYSHMWPYLIPYAQSNHVAIYTVGLGDCDSLILKDACTSTGGRFFYAPTSQGLQQIYQLISRQLRKAYTLKWPVLTPKGASVQASITTTYAGGNGTFSKTAAASFVSPGQ